MFSTVVKFADFFRVNASKKSENAKIIETLKRKRPSTTVRREHDHCCVGCLRFVYDAEKMTCVEALANGADLTEEQHRRAMEGKRLQERERELEEQRERESMARLAEYKERLERRAAEEQQERELEEQREREHMARLSAERIRAAQIEAEERQVLQAQLREAEEPQAKEKVKLRRKAEENLVKIRAARRDAEERSVQAPQWCSRNSELIAEAELRTGHMWLMRQVKAPTGRLGIVLAGASLGVIVKSVNPTCPFRRKVLQGDLIVGIDRTDVSEMTFEQVVGILKESSATGRNLVMLRQYAQTKPNVSQAATTSCKEKED